MTVASELALLFCVELKTEEVWHGPKLKISHPLFTSSISFPNPFDFPLWNTERRCGRQGPKKKKKQRSTLYHLFAVVWSNMILVIFIPLTLSLIIILVFLYVLICLTLFTYLFILCFFYYLSSYFFLIIPNFYVHIPCKCLFYQF